MSYFISRVTWPNVDILISALPMYTLVPFVSGEISMSQGTNVPHVHVGLKLAEC